MGALRPPELACSVSILSNHELGRVYKPCGNQGRAQQKKRRMLSLGELHLVFWNHKPFMTFMARCLMTKPSCERLLGGFRFSTRPITSQSTEQHAKKNTNIEALELHLFLSAVLFANKMLIDGTAFLQPFLLCLCLPKQLFAGGGP